MILKTDCRFFPGDRPCVYNKTEGIMCNKCRYYSPVGFKILIIKLDATGDVLRTTSILHAVKENYPQSYITWLTKKASRDIFKNNNFVDSLIFYEDPEMSSRLQTEKFDLLLHPDASPSSAALASAATAKEKRGFILNDSGKIIPVDSRGIEWLEMGAFDQFKKANKKTYQQIIHEVLGLNYNKGEIIINLDEGEKEDSFNFSKRNNLDKYKRIIGINTGASKRWRLKQWRPEGFEQLISIFSKRVDTAILLYGGKDEEEKNNELKTKFTNVIDTGCDNSLREFFALVNICDIMITGDTLALHTATALKKKVVCLFGPTSGNEIEDYGRIKKVIPEIDCLVCYKQDCDFVPNCMDMISTEMILEKTDEAIRELEKERA
jgi:heptosyltransferase-2